MPIYEFICKDCSRKSTFITLSVNEALKPKCKKCGSMKMEKIVSRVAILRSEESRMESLAHPSKLAGLDENDPRSISRWMKKMGKEMGEDLGDDFDQAVEEAREEDQKAEERGTEGENENL